MIKISKQQRDYLLDTKNTEICVYEEDIHHTHSHRKRYYATASPGVLDALYKMEQEKILLTRTKRA